MDHAAPFPLDLNHPGVRADPYPVYRWYRENAPIYRVKPDQPDGVPRYFLTRWRDIEAGLKNSALKRSTHPHSLWNQPLERIPPELQAYARVTREWPLFRDQPHHAPARRPNNRVLDSPGHREILDAVIHHALEPLRHGKAFDAAEVFARRIALQLNLEMLGIGHRSWIELGAHLQKLSLGFGNVFHQQRLEDASRSMAVLEDWIQEAMDTTRSQPAPFLDRLLAMQAAGKISGANQLTATALLFIQAGQDTTSATIANGILTLLRNPIHIEKLVADPEFASQIVEEVLRFESPVQQTTSHASGPLELGGVAVEPGEAVTFLLGAANRDPEIFENPDEFDPTLTRPRTAAFGFGPHGCPAASFGRDIAATSLRAFFRHFPQARLVSKTAMWKPLATFRSAAELWVEIESL
jgi:pimeloyl-[acyl-carrier protein] synthase